MFLSLFFIDLTATTGLYTLSLHDALPISPVGPAGEPLRRHVAERADDVAGAGRALAALELGQAEVGDPRSEEHTSELQSQSKLVCRLLPEKKNESSRTYSRADGRNARRGR